MHISATPPGAAASTSVASGAGEIELAAMASKLLSTTPSRADAKAATRKRGASRKKAGAKRQPRALPISICPPLTAHCGSIDNSTPNAVTAPAPSKGPSTQALPMRADARTAVPARLTATSSGSPRGSTRVASGR